MFELMFTSFPAVIQYYRLRRRGEAMTVWNMKTAVFMWAVLAFCLFLVIFYFHPKTYAGIVPFRTVSVVAQTSGPVTEIAVENGQQVKAGDLLFRIENRAQRAALAEAEAQVELVASTEAKAEDTKKIAVAGVEEAEAQIRKLKDDLADAQRLLERGAGTANTVLEIETALEATQADLDAAVAQLDLAVIDLEETIPAQKRAADAALESARAALGFTEVRSFTDGTVTQLALSVGSPATTLVLSPAMVIIPERSEGVPVRVAAGFTQTARATIYEGMPAEIACESNASLLFTNAIFPARVASIQPAVAKGQIVPNGTLLDLDGARDRGTLLVLFDLIHKEHEDLLLDGSGCIVQTYTNNIDGVFGHLVAVTGVVKAAGLRMKVLGAIVTGVGLGGGGH
ncbi:MAG: biotin/lipoyl-binding protein [Pseudomonadota bacterium]